MRKLSNYRALSVIAGLTLVLLICNATSYALKNTDNEKLYAEMAGDYEFEYEGQTSIFNGRKKLGIHMEASFGSKVRSG